jgi:hypothetical protein
MYVALENSVETRDYNISMKLRTSADSSRGANVQNPSASHLLAPGKNCWRVDDARRARLLVDGAAYFAALRQVMAAARHSIFVIGWDVDSRIPLHPEGDDDGLPLALGEFLDALATRCGTLQVYVLN